MLVRASGDTERQQLRATHHGALRARDQRQPPVPRLRNLEDVRNLRRPHRLRTHSILYLGNAPNLRAQTRIRTKSRFLEGHTY
jgi:hypothetical protein